MQQLKQKVFIIDDYISNLQIVEKILSNGNYEVSYSESGSHAIGLLNGGDLPDIILFDLLMPVMDGYEATNIIRELDKNIPIIALTANVMKEDIERTKDAGMNEHLNKPINLDKLFSTLHKYLN